jgi:hypothetical protein
MSGFKYREDLQTGHTSSKDVVSKSWGPQCMSSKAGVYRLHPHGGPWPREREA